MIVSGGGKSWFTAQEIADLALPGMTKAKRKVNERADSEGWKVAMDGSGMPLAFGPWNRTTATKSPVRVPALNAS